MSEKRHSLSGSWLGNYYYGKSSQPFSFEAVFIESNGSVEGSILDDGKLGEAKVDGSFADPHLQFTKLYQSPGHEPVLYLGTMSDEGKKLSGTWQINSRVVEGIPIGGATGGWMAWRQDEEDIPVLETEDERDRESEREKVSVMPMTQSQK